MLAILLLVFAVCCPVRAWPDVKVQVTRVGATTAAEPTTQDVTIANFGTPKAFLIFLSSALTDNTAASTAQLMIGAGDCTRYWVAHHIDFSTGGTSDNTRRATATQAVQFHNSSPPLSIVGEATAACITDGIRLSWTLTPANARLMHVVLFGGSDVQARADTVQSAATIGSTVDVTAPNFVVRDVLLSSIGLSLFGNVNSANTAVSIGIANSSAQGTVAHTCDDALVTTNCNAGVHSAWGSVNIAPANWPNFAIELGTFDSQGFTITTREDNAATTYGYLALGYGGVVSSWNGQVNTPGSIGQQAYTGPGWRPQFVLQLLSGVPTANVISDGTETDSNDANGGLFGVSIMTPTAQYCLAIRSDDGTATATTSSLSDDQAVHVLSDAGVDRFVGTLVGMTGSGWTIDYTTTNSAAGWAWAIQAMPTGRRGGVVWFP